jgi:hypothetical protein
MDRRRSIMFSALRLLNSYRNKLITGVVPSPEQAQLANSNIHKYSVHKKTRSLIVMVPGLHPNGMHDLRFRALAHCMAEAGFLVIGIDIPEFRRLEITTNVTKQLEAIFEAIPQEFPEKRVGVLAISYGAGPVFAASRNADFIVSIGGYCDLSKTLKASLTCNESWGRMILAFNQLRELRPNDHPLIREILLLKLNLRNEDAEKLQEGLDDSGKEFLKALHSGLSGNLLSSFIDVIDRNLDVCLELSPGTYLRKLNRETRVYLVHGVSDPLIPYEQSIELETELRKAGHTKVNTLITSALTHADTVSGRKIGETWNLLRWMNRVLSEV